MDSVATLKRRRSDSFSVEKCLLCQKCGKDGIRKCTPQGIHTLKEALATRLKYNCDKYMDTIDRLQGDAVDLVDSSKTLLWHKNCFSSFTSSSHLDRLRRRFESSMSSSHNPIENSANVTCVDHVKQCEPQKPPSRRSSISAVQWDRCIYCQCESKAKVHQILTLETSDRILNGAKLDCILRYRLAGISDLVAAEAKYHLQCHASFMQNLNKTQAAIGADNLSSYNQACFNAVVQELEKGLDGGNIYTVKSVWDRYCELMTTTSINTSTLSSSSDSNALRAFRKKLESSLGDKVEFITNTSKKESLLIVPSVTKDSIFQTLKDTAVDKDTKDTECALQTFSLIGERDNILKSIYYVSSKVKMDIKNGVGHATYSGIDKDHTEEVVPQSLFLLLSMILGENEECDNHSIESLT